MKSNWLRRAGAPLLVALLLALVLALVFMAYLQPGFLLDLANRVYLCM